MTQVVAIFAARTGRIGRFVWSGWAGLAALFLSCALWQAGHAPILVVTGGKREGDRTTEAAAGRSFAVARGVPAAQIRSEDHGRNTLESLRAVETPQPTAVPAETTAASTETTAASTETTAAPVETAAAPTL